MSPEIVDLLIKGLTLLPALVDAGINITQRVEQLKKVAQEGDSMPDDEIASIRAQFDADLAEFNAPME
jgi:hypothetical protein